MKHFNFGDCCWFKDELWRYVGQGEDGDILLCRPMSHSCYDLIETLSIYVTDDEDYDLFCKENGESHTEYCKRKRIDLPKESK